VKRIAEGEGVVIYGHDVRYPETVERREGSTRMTIIRVPDAYAGNLSLSLAYSVGLHSHRLERHVNPYPVGTRQAEAWDAGRASR
jgi:hypothetical protein